MSQRVDLDLSISSVLLTAVAGLYYFALQPWAILARSLLIILTFVFSKAIRQKSVKHTQRMAASNSLVESLELKTKRAITIETALSDRTLGKCHPQQESPLFYKLPKELRDYIFELSCAQSPSAQHAYDVNSYYYRPDHTSRLRTYTSLLQTCRRVWIETHALPMRQAEHAFWFQRGPYDRHPDNCWQANVQNEKDRYIRLFHSLTTRNLKNVSHIRLFVQMFQVEQMAQGTQLAGFFRRRLVEKGFAPKRITVTLRSSDWADWEQGRLMTLPDNFVRRMLDSPCLGCVDEFALELETDEKRVYQLDAIVQRLTGFEGRPKLVDSTGQDRSKVCKFVLRDGPKSIHWSRSPRINSTDYDIYNGIPTLHLRATTMIWKNKPCDMPEDVPQAAFTPDEGNTDRLVGHGFTVRRTAPTLIFRSQALRERLRSGGWIVGRFPEKEEEMRVASMGQAGAWQRSERERFEKMFGDIEAKRLLAEWEREGSLLTFVEESC